MKIIEKYKIIPKAVKSSMWFVVCSVLQKGIAFLTTPIFTRLMTTEQYGQVTIYNSWLEIFMIFCTLNIFYGVYNNALTKYPEDRNIVTSSMQGLCTTITLIVFLIYIFFQNIINSLTGMTTIMTCLLFCEILFVPAFRFWAAKQRYEYEYKTLVALSLVISILTPLLGIPAVLLSTNKGIAKIITSVLSQLVVSVIIYILLFKNGKKFYSKKYWKYALVFNLPLIPHYLSSTILNQCDRVMIDKMCGTNYAGIYGLAYTIGMIAIIFNEAIMHSFTPWTYQNLKKENYQNIKNISKYLVIFIGVLSVMLVSLAPEITYILGGEEYLEGMWIIAPISASIFFRFLYSLYGNIEFYYEENYFIMIASVITAIINIILNYIFIKRFGYLAAGYTTLLCFMIYAISHCAFSKHVLKKHINKSYLYDNKFIFLVGIIVVILCSGMMLLYSHNIIRYAFLIITFLIIIVFKNKIINLIKLIRCK